MAFQDYNNAFQAAAEVSMVPSDPKNISLTTSVQQPISLAAELQKLEE